MASRVWTFLLPGSGSHQLRVDHIGTQNQIVFCDSQQLAPHPGSSSLHYSGPEGTLIELRRKNNANGWGFTSSSANDWTLHVNGWLVEEYNVDRRAHGDESLRELRNKPDGSYLIAPSFDASLVDLNTVRKFEFIVSEQLHELRIAHSDCIWQIVVDGQMVDRKAHRLADQSGDAAFNIPGPLGEQVPVEVQMEWPTTSNTTKAWMYRLRVNGVDVPHNWTKQTGSEPVQPPVVFSSASYAQAEEQAAALAPYPAPVPAYETPAQPDVLPQGVSYDGSSGRYQANIRNKAGKFVCLGEFLTAEDAHQAYVQAVPVYSPEKQIVPTLYA